MGTPSVTGTSAGLLGRLAVEMNLLSATQLGECIRVQGEQVQAQRLGDVMVDLGFLDSRQLARLLEAQRTWIAQDRSRVAATDGVGATDFSTHTASHEFSDVEPPTLHGVHPILGELLYESRHKGASDLHVHAGSVPFMRLHGQVVPLGKEPVDREMVEAMAASILTAADDTGDSSDPQSTADLPQDRDLSWEHPTLGRTRVSVFISERGHGIVMRLIPTHVPTQDELSQPSIVARATTYPEGLVLVTGGAGSGKSSTVAALVRLLNEERQQNIIMLEDPIEYRHTSRSCNVIQRQIPEHSASFATALRAALREDPDVIVIGEMRDIETIGLAITAAETGHLVLGTLHTASAARTIDRIVTAFPAEQQGQVRAMLSESLRMVISQRLLPRADEPGRVPAIELLFNTPAVGKLIRDRRSYQIENVMQTSRNVGMRRMVDSIQELTQAGIIAREEA